MYLVPVAPGVTRAYNKVVLKNVASRTKSIFNFLSRTVLSSGFFHAFGHGLVDQVGARGAGKNAAAQSHAYTCGVIRGALCNA